MAPCVQHLMMNLFVRKSTPKHKSPSPLPPQHQQKKHQKVTMPVTKNPPVTVKNPPVTVKNPPVTDKKHVVMVATVEEDNESVLDE